MWVLIGCAALLPGCGKTPAPHFQLNMPLMIQSEISVDDRQWIADTLRALFGTPDAPEAPAGSGLDAGKLRIAAGPVWSDELGAKHGLYRRHCAHCHGVSGDGRGPTAMFLNPYPRDYRPGVFKFKSTDRGSMPTHDDLVQILHEGINGTAMPSFKLLADDEIEALVEYVKYLAMRGQMELALVEFIQLEIEEEDGVPHPFKPDEDKFAYQREAVLGMVEMVASTWSEASGTILRPDESMLPEKGRPQEQLAESITRGRALFFGEGGCVKCHGPTALGDGQTDDFNDWNKFNKEFIEATAKMVEQVEGLDEELRNEEAKEQRDSLRRQIEETTGWLEARQLIEPSLLPVRNIMPRNLRQGIYRGGRRPLDIYWRVKAGIPGTPMPAAPGKLTDKDIWDIVAYVHSLPFEPASQPQHAAPVNERPTH